MSIKQLQIAKQLVSLANRLVMGDPNRSWEPSTEEEVQSYESARKESEHITHDELKVKIVKQANYIKEIINDLSGMVPALINLSQEPNGHPRQFDMYKLSLDTIRPMGTLSDGLHLEVSYLAGLISALHDQINKM